MVRSGPTVRVRSSYSNRDGQVPLLNVPLLRQLSTGRLHDRPSVIRYVRIPERVDWSARRFARTPRGSSWRPMGTGSTNDEESVSGRIEHVPGEIPGRWCDVPARAYLSHVPFGRWLSGKRTQWPRPIPAILCSWGGADDRDRSGDCLRCGLRYGPRAALDRPATLQRGGRVGSHRGPDDRGRVAGGQFRVREVGNGGGETTPFPFDGRGVRNIVIRWFLVFNPAKTKVSRDVSGHPSARPSRLRDSRSHR